MTEVAAGTWNALLLIDSDARGLAVLTSDGAAELIDGVIARTGGAALTASGERRKPNCPDGTGRCAH